MSGAEGVPSASRVARPGSPPRRLPACEVCSKARTKCHFRDHNISKHLCDRCERMKYDCKPRSTKSLRKPRQIKPQESSSSLDPTGSAPAHAPLPIRTPGDPCGSGDSCTEHDTPWPIDYRQNKPDNTGVDLNVAPFGLSWEQCQDILDDYKQNFVRFFPFVAVDPDSSARDLYRDKPFLFRNILLAAAPLPQARLEKISRKVKAYMCHHLILNAERTLDLMQGLLLSVAWAQFAFLLDHEVTNLVYLSLGYAHNLGISKIPLPVLQSKTRDPIPDDARRAKLLSCLITHHTTEEKRTLLGCYSILAANSAQFGRSIPLSMQYIDMCCDDVALYGLSSDDMVVKSTRLTQIGEEIAYIFGAPRDRERGKPFSFIIDNHVPVFRTRLEALAQSISPSHPQYPYFYLEYNYLLVRLYEPASLLKDLFQESSGQAIFRNSCLAECLAAARAFFDTLFSCGYQNLQYSSLAIVEHVSFILVITTRLLLLKAPGWDLDLARAQFDLPRIIDRFVDMLYQAESSRQARVRNFALKYQTGVDADDVNTGMFVFYANKMRWVKSWYEGRLAGHTSEQIFLEDPPTQNMDGWIPPGMPGDNPGWFIGLLGSSSWNFDDI